MAASPDTKMKVVMLGKEATGKTSLVERFLSGRFQGEGQVKSTIAGAYGGRYLLLASVSEQYADNLHVSGRWSSTASPCCSGCGTRRAVSASRASRGCITGESSTLFHHHAQYNGESQNGVAKELYIITYCYVILDMQTDDTLITSLCAVVEKLCTS